METYGSAIEDATEAIALDAKYVKVQYLPTLCITSHQMQLQIRKLQLEVLCMIQTLLVRLTTFTALQHNIMHASQLGIGLTSMRSVVCMFCCLHSAEVR